MQRLSKSIEELNDSLTLIRSVCDGEQKKSDEAKEKKKIQVSLNFVYVKNSTAS
jgi:hypothetical protein